MRRRDFIKGFGGVAAMPLAAHAQERAKPLVGFLSSRSPAESEGLVEAFRRGLGEAGFVDGQSVVITFRWAEGRYDRLQALAAELVGLGVTVLVAAGGHRQHARPKRRLPRSQSSSPEVPTQSAPVLSRA